MISTKESGRSFIFFFSKIKLYIVFILFNNLLKLVKSYLDSFLIIGSFTNRISIKYSFTVISSFLFFIFKNEISIIFLLKHIFNMISISTMKLE